MTNTETAEKVEIREFYAILKWVFSIYLEVTPVYTIINILSSIYDQSRDIVYSFIFAKTLDELIKIAQSPNANMSQITPYIAVMLGYNITTSIIMSLGRYFERAQRITSRPKIEEKFYKKLKTLGIQTLEQPEINNKIQRSGDTVSTLFSFIQDLTDLVAAVAKLVSTAAILIVTLPILAPLMILAAIPEFFVDKRFRRLFWRLDKESTEKRRMASASLGNITNAKSLQEVLVTNSFNYLSNKYQEFHMWYISAYLKMRKKSYLLNSVFNLSDNLIYYFGVIKIFQRLFLKQITIGDVTFQMRMLGVFQSALYKVTGTYNQLFETAIRLKDSYELYNTTPAVPDGTLDFPKLIKGPQITIRNVDFMYSGANKYISKNLNLNIKPGEKVAIVGHNGAGKTTLIKLICRMYGIQNGEILINNQTLTELKIESWYQNIGVLFQDFNMYPQLTAKENILMGLSQEAPDEEKIIEAAKSADAHNFILDFKHGYDQVLSERYKEGIRPSTGQWQKLAIARFFYRNAPLVIFDEPTASIDAVSEYNIFNKIYKFFEGKTVIIISHRFSTVRNADRIIVLEKGQIVEEGNHTELMAHNGEYAKAFLLQAEGYSNSGATSIVNNVL